MLSLSHNNKSHVFIYSVTIILFSRYDACWSILKALYTKNLAYSWLCEEYTKDTVLDANVCSLQIHAIETLYLIWKAFKEIGALFAIILYKYYGRKLCGAIGIILGLISAIFQLRLQNWTNVYALSSILGGIAINAVTLPCFEIKKFYPSYQSIVIPYFIGIQGLGVLLSRFVITMSKVFGAQPRVINKIWLGVILALILPYCIIYMKYLIEDEKTNKNILDISNDKLEIKNNETILTKVIESIFTMKFLMLNLLLNALVIAGESYYISIRDMATVELGLLIDGMSIISPITIIAVSKLSNCFGITIILVQQLLSYSIIIISLFLNSFKFRAIIGILFIITRAYTSYIKYDIFNLFFPSTISDIMVGISSAITGTLILILINYKNSLGTIFVLHIAYAFTLAAIIPIIYLWYHINKNEAMYKLS